MRSTEQSLWSLTSVPHVLQTWPAGELATYTTSAANQVGVETKHSLNRTGR